MSRHESPRVVMHQEKTGAGVEAWKQLEEHRAVQAQGRAEVFKDYRLRVAGVLRDYGMFEREQAPLDEPDPLL